MADAAGLCIYWTASVLPYLGSVQRSSGKRAPESTAHCCAAVDETIQGWQVVLRLEPSNIPRLRASTEDVVRASTIMTGVKAQNLSMEGCQDI